jgi:hypothetical protein
MISQKGYVTRNEVLDSLNKDFPRNAATLEQIRANILRRRGPQRRNNSTYLVSTERVQACLDCLFSMRSVLKVEDGLRDTVYLAVNEIASQ